MRLNHIVRRGRAWVWPAYDTGLIRAFDTVDDIDAILPHVAGRGLCVQAGGACGVWPARLCELFERVVTFEPDPTNCDCLQANAGRAIAVNAALGDKPGRTAIIRHPSLTLNAGAGYADWADGPVRVVTLDGEGLIDRAIDLLLLDVEGAEYKALLGGRERIAADRPVVVIEEKPLPQGGDHLAARRLLESWGYREVGSVHRDVIFRPC